MTIVDEYIRKATRAIAEGNSQQIDTVAREIVSAFSNEIPNISSYRGSRLIGDSPVPHTVSDLRKLLGKLRIYQESKDRELYGQYGLTAISDSINQLEFAISESNSENQYQALFNKVDRLYANKYDNYVDGLCGWGYNDNAPDERQAILRIEKLRIIRDEELRKVRIAETQNTQISLTQNQETNAIATSYAMVSLMETCDKIDAISDDKLSAEDKDYLKGLLTSFEQAISKDKPDKQGRLSKILTFLADKSIDVVIAAIPFILNLIQSM